MSGIQLKEESKDERVFKLDQPEHKLHQINRLRYQ